MIDFAWFDLILIVLSSLAIHRLWLKESIFIKPREWAVARLTAWILPGVAKAISCPPCFAVWCCVISLAGWCISPIVIAIPAAYTAVRWGMDAWFLLERQTQFAAYSPQGAVPPPPTWQTSVGTPPVMTSTFGNTVSNAVVSIPEPAKSCGACQAAKDAAQRPRIILMTSFMSFDRAYSLASVVIDQARALAMLNVPVEVWCSEGVSMAQWPADMPSSVRVLGRVPSVEWKEDVIEQATVDRLVAFLRQSHEMLRGAIVITHDLQFVAHYATFAKALRDVGPLEGVRWFHECHSRPGTHSPNPSAQWRQSLMVDHRAVVPTDHDRGPMARYFGVSEDAVVAVPHVRDIRTLNRWCAQSRRIVDARPDLLNADIVQVYPFSTPRGTAKGVETLIDVFSRLNELGLVAKLVLVNAHAAGEESRVAVWRARADAAGVGRNVIITSELGFPQGVSGDAVADLQQIANVFVFPTASESFGLVAAEAALNKQVMVVPSNVRPVLDVIDPAFAYGVDFTAEGAAGLAADFVSLGVSAGHFSAQRDALRRFSLEAVGQRLIDAVGWSASSDTKTG
jgi:glycosyltransferase involved in cell wall biosynthesis